MKYREKTYNQVDYANKYNKEHYERLVVMVDLGTKERIKNVSGENLSAFVKRVINAELERIENDD